jgi:Domain of unknown function (DUF5666)
MSHLPSELHAALRGWARALATVVFALASIALLAAVLGLSACGGGVGTGGTGSATPSNYSAGPISGFGSVIVNDIVFDDANASVEDGSGGRRQRTELRLGMTVEIDADTPQVAASATTAKASRVRFDSALLGPVEALASGAFTALGQSVVVDALTVFEDALAGGLSALRVGQVVEVYGVLDNSAPATPRLRATRVEIKPSASTYKLRGTVAQLDGTAQTLRVGASLFAFAGAAGIPANLAVGSVVSLVLRTTPDASGRRVITAFGAALQALEDRDSAEVKGLITALASSTSFQLDGRPVNAAGATFTPSAAALGVGVRVQVEGTVRSGVLVARSVKVKTDADEQGREFELRGNIESANAALRSFVVRGTTIVTTRSDLRFENGSAADLLVGRAVEVKGFLAPSGNAVAATRIKFP